MKSKHSKGTWKVGNSPTVVVTDNGHGFQANTRHSDVYYYGGFLIAESILKVEDAKLIAAAPELLEQLVKARELLVQNGFRTWSYVIIDIDNAIKKATE